MILTEKERRRKCRRVGIMKQKRRMIIGLRILLCALIVANMTVIFLFSAQSGEESDKTSGKVSETVAEITVKDFEEKPQEEQDRIVLSINKPLRKIAHMAEFGSLGALVFLLLLTWRGAILWRYGASLGATLLYACTDELHQMLSDARGPQATDVLIDLSGALITCTVLLGICAVIKKKKGTLKTFMQTTHYYLQSDKLEKPLRIAVAADLHGERFDRLILRIRAEQPDMILIPGDLMDDHDLANADASGFAFLRECVAIAPTFYSLGNHEIACYHKGKPWTHPTPTFPGANAVERIRQTGAVFLDNDCTLHEGMTVCGLTSGLNGKKNEPDRKALKRFANAKGFRILLCHHPEYFVPYIQKTDIDLTVCGHAHGGQWRAFGLAAYAPGQGIFPKYTSGVIDGRCVISRGLGNHTVYPRFFNPRELVIVHYGETAPSKKQKKRVAKT